MQFSDLKTVVFETSLGQVPVRGRFGNDLTVLAITGMLAATSDMERFPVAVEPHAGVVVRLPGHGAPRLSQTTVPAFAAAFDEVVDRLGPSVVVGLSIGALVALSMRSEQIRSVIAVEPPLETAKLWSLVASMKATWREHAEFYENVMGFDGEYLGGRNYLDLLDQLWKPTHFVAGDLPLFPVRTGVSRLPSTVDEAHRRMISATRGATLHIAPGSGHGVQFQAPQFLLGVIQQVCEVASQGDASGLQGRVNLGLTR